MNVVSTKKPMDAIDFPCAGYNAMFALVIFALAKLDLIVGESSANFVLLTVLVSSFVIGLAIAMHMKAHRLTDYRLFGGAGR